MDWLDLLADHEALKSLLQHHSSGNGNSPQYSCLENSMDRGAWRATAHGVTKSWTWLSNWTKLNWIFSKTLLWVKGKRDSVFSSDVARNLTKPREPQGHRLIIKNLFKYEFYKHRIQVNDYRESHVRRTFIENLKYYLNSILQSEVLLRLMNQ